MAICVITLLLQVQWLFPLLRYFFVIPNTISKFMDLRTYYSTSVLPGLDQYLMIYIFSNFQ